MFRALGLSLVVALGIAAFWPIYRGFPVSYAADGRELARRVFVPLTETTEGVDESLAAFAARCAARAATAEADRAVARRGVDLAGELARLRSRHAEWTLAYRAHLGIPEKSLAIGTSGAVEDRRKKLLVEEGPVRQWQQELERARGTVAALLRALVAEESRLHSSRQMVATETSMPLWKWLYLRYGPQAMNAAGQLVQGVQSHLDFGGDDSPGDQTDLCPGCRGGGTVSCATCGGRGMVDAKEQKACDPCGGSGRYRLMSKREIDCQFCRGRGFVEKNVFANCPACGATGRTKCSRCQGAGRISTAR